MCSISVVDAVGFSSRISRIFWAISAIFGKPVNLVELKVVEEDRSKESLVLTDDEFAFLIPELSLGRTIN